MTTTTRPTTSTGTMTNTGTRKVLATLFAVALSPAMANAEPTDQERRLQAAHVARAVALLEQGDVPQAIAELDQALTLDPGDWRAWHNRGVAYRRAARNAEAIEDFSRALRIEPRRVESWNGRGVARQAEGDHGGATADFDAALRVNPRSVAALNNRGVSWRALGDTGRALADFDRALELSPRYATGLANRGATWRSAGNWARARKDLDAAIAVDSSLALAYFNRATLELAQDRPERAIADFAAAAMRQPDGEAELWLFLARKRAGENAAARLSGFVESQAGSWQALIGRHLLGHISASELLLAARKGTAVEREGRICEAWFFAAESSLLRGDEGAAVTRLGQVVDSCPDGYAELDHAIVELRRINHAQRMGRDLRVAR